MALHLTNPSSRRYERGGVSWVTILLLALALGAAYLVITWAPVHVLHYQAKQVVREYMNQAIKNQNDRELVEKMCLKLATLDKMTVVDANGNEQIVPTVQVAPSDVTWERDRDSTPPTIRVSFEYVREVRYPFSERVSEWVGSVDLEGDITIPNWGPER